MIAMIDTDTSNPIVNILMLINNSVPNHTGKVIEIYWLIQLF